MIKSLFNEEYAEVLAKQGIIYSMSG